MIQIWSSISNSKSSIWWFSLFFKKCLENTGKLWILDEHSKQYLCLHSKPKERTIKSFWKCFHFYNRFWNQSICSYHILYSFFFLFFSENLVPLISSTFPTYKYGFNVWITTYEEQNINFFFKLKKKKKKWKK